MVGGTLHTRGCCALLIEGTAAESVLSFKKSCRTPATIDGCVGQSFTGTRQAKVLSAMAMPIPQMSVRRYVDRNCGLQKPARSIGRCAKLMESGPVQWKNWDGHQNQGELRAELRTRATLQRTPTARIMLSRDSGTNSAFSSAGTTWTPLW